MVPSHVEGHDWPSSGRGRVAGDEEDIPLTQQHRLQRTVAAHVPQHRRLPVIAGIVLSAMLAASLVQPPSEVPVPAIRLLVHETSPASRAAEDLVHALGGDVTRSLPLIGGFAAVLPQGRVASLAGDPSIAELVPDGRVRMSGGWGAAYDALDPNLAWRRAIGLGWVPDGIDGSGVTVALIDTGLARLGDFEDRVLARVDFTPGGAGDDGYGHGTHMAGVIAGSGGASGGKWRGVAPDARLVSVKVAGRDGSTDVSVVIAAIQWVVMHRAKYGIKVLNLSFGTDGTQPYALDPLDAAVERAWAAGITVVVAAGNRGPAQGTINKPGDDPFVITVGAVDTKQTAIRLDDAIAPFSGRGPTRDGISKPELLAPGTTIVATRDVGSTIDRLHPAAVIDEAYFKGTGTSQAAAIVSGVAALMYEANPSLTPNRVKGLLIDTAHRGWQYRTEGSSGLIDAADAVGRAWSWAPNPNAGLAWSTGRGTIEGSRGSFHVEADLDGDGDPDLVEGEVDVLGDPWDSNSWSSNSWLSTSWSPTSWSSLISENAGWSSTSWSSTSWSGTSWSSTSWSSNSWSSNSWSSNTWS
jgi:serine protease AprX